MNSVSPQLVSKLIDYIYLLFGFAGVIYAFAHMNDMADYYVSRIGNEDTLVQEAVVLARQESRNHCNDVSRLRSSMSREAMCKSLQKLGCMENPTADKIIDLWNNSALRTPVDIIGGWPATYRFSEAQSRVVSLIYLRNLKKNSSSFVSVGDRMMGFILIAIATCLRILKTSIELSLLYRKSK